MIKYWLVITNDKNWKTVQKNLIYGFCERHEKDINRLKKGDIIIVYVVPKKIGGFFKINEFRKIDIIKFNDGNYPFQIDLKKIKILKEPLIIGDKFQKRDIENNISIFKGKSRWGTVLMGRSLVEINERDYKYLINISENG